MAQTNKRFQANQSILTSAVVHFSVLGALAICGVSQQITQARSLKMSWGNAQVELQSIAIRGFDLESDENRENEVELDLPALETQLPELAIEQVTVNASDEYSELFQPLADSPIRNNSGSGQDRSRHSSQHRIESDRGQGRAGGGQAVTFFGAGAPAQKIVFVLDNSGSMKQPMYAQSRDRVLKAEVMRAVRSLEEEMSFDVIYFNEKVLELDARGMRPATAENKRDMLKWIRAVIPDKDTWPGPALNRALELKPDIIFFLTDGVFAGETVDEITEKNESNIPIFTICLGDPRGAIVLTRLASRNGGLYRFIP